MQDSIISAFQSEGYLGTDCSPVVTIRVYYFGIDLQNESH